MLEIIAPDNMVHHRVRFCRPSHIFPDRLCLGSDLVGGCLVGGCLVGGCLREVATFLAGFRFGLKGSRGNLALAEDIGSSSRCTEHEIESESDKDDHGDELEDDTGDHDVGGGHRGCTGGC